MARNPEDIARSGVEKALKAEEKAHEKHENLQAKADEAYEALKRAQRELKWTASHPDLPEDFDLDEFRRSLEAPFEEGEIESGVTEVVNETGEPEAVSAPEPVTEDVVEEKVDATPASIDEADGDDPWAADD